MPQLLGLLLLGAAMVLVAMQNSAPLLPLVVLGQPVLVLPLGWWLAGAIGAGAVTMGVVGLLGRLGRSGRRGHPVPPSANRADRAAASPRQRILETSLGDESAPAGSRAADDEWETEGGESARSKSSRRWRWLSLEAEPRPSVNAADLEEELSGWSAPDRPQKGWSYDPEWDEWDGESAQPAAAARSAPVDRPRPANRIDRPFDLADESQSDRPTAPPPAPAPPAPAPPAKPIEAPVQPTASDRQGTVYSIRYRRDAEVVADAPATDKPPAPDLPPPETRSLAVTDADYRVLIPPPPEDPAPPPRDRPIAPKPEIKDDWEDDW